MVNQYRLSDVTKDYVNEFYCILDEMVQGMTQAELTDSISGNFIARMIPHHQAAIEMSYNILRFTTDLCVQEIAQRIISEQTRSIENMCKIREECLRVCNTKRDVCLYERRVDQIMGTMFSHMEHACTTNQINNDFMREMIPHHKGAVELSENALCYPICPRLKPILQAIIVSQKRGICQMQRLLCTRR